MNYSSSKGICKQTHWIETNALGIVQTTWVGQSQ